MSQRETAGESSNNWSVINNVQIFDVDSCFFCRSDCTTRWLLRFPMCFLLFKSEPSRFIRKRTGSSSFPFSLLVRLVLETALISSRTLNFRGLVFACILPISFRISSGIAFVRAAPGNNPVLVAGSEISPLFSTVPYRRTTCFSRA